MDIKSFLSSLNTKELSNTQKVARQLLQAEGGWVPRTAFKVANATSRLRELRSKAKGAMKVQCASAAELNKKTSARQTFYRLDPASVTKSSLKKVFEGVVATSDK